MSSSVVQPEPVVVVARVVSVEERAAGGCRVVLADTQGVEAVLWLALGAVRPGVGQRVAVEVNERGVPQSWSRA